MSENSIPRKDIDLLTAAINRIISTEVLEKELTNQLPLITDLTDSNKVFQVKSSLLFVDMRESTKLPDAFDPNQLVKIYRSYVRTIVQSIRYSGGLVRDFMGDGVLAVFIDNEEGKSEDKAVHAARYITTTIDKILNPALDQALGHRISCGIGIHTGTITLSKVGMKGKEQQDDAESEFGIAWIGNSTNLACKFSSAVSSGSIFISTSTYSALSDIASKQNWKKTEIHKNANTLKGYIAKQYYLDLDCDIIPCTADEANVCLSLAEELGKKYQEQLSEIKLKAIELGKKDQKLCEIEKRLLAETAELDRKKNSYLSELKRFHEQEYASYCDILRSGHCKKEYVIAMGADFWDKNLNKAIEAGNKLGKTEKTVKQEVSYAMVSIYESLEAYDKAYDFLVAQASGHSWLHLFTVQKLVNKVGHCTRLRGAIYLRLKLNDIPPENREEFERINDWLIKL